MIDAATDDDGQEMEEPKTGIDIGTEAMRRRDPRRAEQDNWSPSCPFGPFCIVHAIHPPGNTSYLSPAGEQDPVGVHGGGWA